MLFIVFLFIFFVHFRHFLWPWYNLVQLLSKILYKLEHSFYLLGNQISLWSMQACSSIETCSQTTYSGLSISFSHHSFIFWQYILTCKHNCLKSLKIKSAWLVGFKSNYCLFLFIYLSCLALSFLVNCFAPIDSLSMLY